MIEILLTLARLNLLIASLFASSEQEAPKQKTTIASLQKAEQDDRHAVLLAKLKELEHRLDVRLSELKKEDK